MGFAAARAHGDPQRALGAAGQVTLGRLAVDEEATARGEPVRRARPVGPLLLADHEQQARPATRHRRPDRSAAASIAAAIPLASQAPRPYSRSPSSRGATCGGTVSRWVDRVTDAPARRIGTGRPHVAAPWLTSWIVTFQSRATSQRVTKSTTAPSCPVGDGIDSSSEASATTSVERSWVIGAILGGAECGRPLQTIGRRGLLRSRAASECRHRGAEGGPLPIPSTGSRLTTEPGDATYLWKDPNIHRTCADPDHQAIVPRRASDASPPTGAERLVRKANDRRATVPSGRASDGLYHSPSRVFRPPRLVLPARPGLPGRACGAEAYRPAV